jgi:hypothetical protein
LAPTATAETQTKIVRRGARGLDGRRLLIL